jgi:hypothetical protein
MKEGIEALNAITDKILAYGPSRKGKQKRVSKAAKPKKRARQKAKR